VLPRRRRASDYSLMVVTGYLVGRSWSCVPSKKGFQED